MDIDEARLKAALEPPNQPSKLNLTNSNNYLPAGLGQNNNGKNKNRI